MVRVNFACERILVQFFRRAALVLEHSSKLRDIL